MSRMRRPEGSVRRRSDGRWEVRVQTGINYDTGAPIRKSLYARSEEEANRLLHKALADPALAKHLDKEKCTLNEWLEKWLEIYVKDGVRISTFNREPLKIDFQKETWRGIIKIIKRGGQYHEEIGWHV